MSSLFLHARVDSCEVTLFLGTFSIERVVIELDEASNDFGTFDLLDLNLTKLSGLGRLRAALDLQLVV